MDITSFLSASNYETPSEFKKLKFIFKIICRYSEENNIDIRNLKILEVACGRGNITLPLASLGCRVRCFDISRDAIESLKHEVMLKGIKNLNATIEDAYTFDDGNKYHIVIASEVFEHVIDPKRLSENIKNHLMPGSCLIVTIPNGYGPWELSNRLLWYHLIRSNYIRKLLERPKFSPYPGEIHCQYYTRNKMINIVNLSVINFSKSDSILAALWPIYHFKNKTINSIDVLLADILPYWLASGWYFAFKYSVKP